MRTNFASLVFFSWYTIYEWISDCKAPAGAPSIVRKLRHYVKIVLFITAWHGVVGRPSNVAYESAADRQRLTMQPTTHREGQ